jgi:hypothetical protein
MPSGNSLDGAIRSARRDIGEVPAPLPANMAAPIVVPEHDPDPAVRDEARARLRVGAKQ